jgi:type IX secretion system substrate protein
MFGFTDIKQTTDENFVIAGTARELSSSKWHILVMKIDSQGNAVWGKRVDYTGNTEAMGVKVIPLSNGDFYVFGSIFSATTLPSICIIKMDSMSNVLWNKTLISNTNLGIIAADTGCNKELFVCAYAVINNGNKHLILKIDSNVTVQWSYLIDSTFFPNCIKSVTCDSLLLTGNSYGNRLFISSLDTSGAFIWSKIYNQKVVCFGGGSSINTHSNGQFTLIATAYFFNGIYKIYFIREAFSPNLMCNDSALSNPGLTVFPITIVDTLITLTNLSLINLNFPFTNYSGVTDSLICGSVTFVPNIQSYYSDFSIFPNPSNDFITIHYNLSSTKQTTVSLFNPYGQPLTPEGELSRTSGQEIKIDMRNFPAGIYLVKVRVGEKEGIKKVVKY